MIYSTLVHDKTCYETVLGRLSQTFLWINQCFPFELIGLRNIKLRGAGLVNPIINISRLSKEKQFEIHDVNIYVLFFEKNIWTTECVPFITVLAANLKKKHPTEYFFKTRSQVKKYNSMYRTIGKRYKHVHLCMYVRNN